MTKLRLVRGSEVSSFLADRNAWKLRWVDHLVKKQQDGKLFFGTLFHKYLEFRYKYWFESSAEILNMVNAWLREQDTSAMDVVFYQEMIDMFHGIVENYESVYSYELERMQVIATELRFAIPLYEDDPAGILDGQLDFAYEGTIDLVYCTDGKNLQFMDHKTVSSIDRYVSNAVLDRQISRYWWALSALREGHGYVWEDEQWKHVSNTVFGQKVHSHLPVSKFTYNLIRKEVPKKPNMLKGGGLSKAKNQNTTRRLYEQTIEQLGLNPSEYSDVLEEFSDQKFLRRVEVVRNWNECCAAMDDFTKAAKDMLQLRKAVKEGDESGLYWNITWDTPTFNAYFPLIQAEVMGENVSMVRAALYQVEYHNEGDEYIEVGD